MEEKGLKEFFDQMAPKWDKMSRTNEVGIRTILQLTGLEENEKILDIATGTGVLIPFFMEYDPKAITAIDISTEMINLAKEKFKDQNVDFKAVDFLNLQEKGFDYLMCYRSFPHFADKKAAVEKFYDCLVPGGRFVIAHTEGKEATNKRHASQPVGKYTNALIPVEEEASLFENLFDLDILVDTDKFYIISGTKK